MFRSTLLPATLPGDGMRWVAAASTTFGVLWRKGSWSWTRKLGKTAPERTTHLKLKLFTTEIPVSLKLLLPLNIKSRAFEYFFHFDGVVLLLYHSAIFCCWKKIWLSIVAHCICMNDNFLNHIIIHHRCQYIYILYKYIQILRQYLYPSSKKGSLFMFVASFFG